MIKRGWSKRAIIKYTLLQIPSALLALGGLWYLMRIRIISLWMVWLILALWVIKDIILFFFVWPAFEDKKTQDQYSMIGQRGVVKNRLSAEGYATIRGELWRIKLAQGYEPIEAGQPVRVIDRQGLTLLVVPDNR